MAIVVSSAVIGRMRGRIGNVVLSEWNNIETARKSPSKGTKKEPSPVVAKNRTVFGLVSSFFKTATKTIRDGWQLPRYASLSAYNSAVSQHLSEAVTFKKGNHVLDLTKVKLSNVIKSTQQVWNPVFQAEANYMLTLIWELTPDAEKETRLDDRVVFVCYNATVGKFFNLNLPVRRTELVYRMGFSNWYRKHEMYGYVFVISQDGKRVSETEYLGMVTLME